LSRVRIIRFNLNSFWHVNPTSLLTHSELHISLLHIFLKKLNTGQIEGLECWTCQYRLLKEFKME
jgi:hypothetical protein